MSRRSWLFAALAVLPLAGCTGSPAPSSTSTSTARPALTLVAFDSCAQLEKELRAAAKKYGREPVAIDDMRAMPEQARGGVPAAKSYSGTNVHEAGADEPDIVKTDGRRIVTVTGGVLKVVDPATRTQTGRLDLGIESFGEPKLLLSGDHALVLADGGPSYLKDSARFSRPDGGRSEVLLIDLTGTPRLLSRYRGDGSLVDARQTGSVARVVLSSRPQIDSWVPAWEITTGSARTTGKLDCSQVSKPETFTGASMLRVLTFDLAATALSDGSPVALVADGDAVYATESSLYIANNESPAFRRRVSSAGDVAPDAVPKRDTEIYRFTLPPAGKPVYVAAGKVPGTLLNQYSMSEWDGHLRVATTNPASESSAVRVLKESNGKLAEVGSVDGLGKGEQIYSVRFLGARGYVVTFRQTDPLYSLDLADPAHPRFTGELKINGYSAHLQPAGENRLIGIGQEATSEGRPLGTQISLFDVSDPAAPRRLDQHVVPGSMSEAEIDPHAVLWWEATSLLVVPLSDARSDGPLALHVTGDQLKPADRLTMNGPVRRSLVIGDVLWSVADSGLLASNASTLDKITWVALK
ncbi:beta-propeller domain-containing protein [Paractinoplanes atraurantiacus]|uniref:Secreted protein containing C-terminal beta-propeller domain n=1 Tax=Paractinoplanes atraurantiacus TaxID=1036182 RepID=A0A285JDX8_9ACTN|nr:beta-propeller domain-containing protein [Actinoplanes atraurantiacus]SNY58490.1 Secreted protein containing C-terminal beta-propeller domain [Actinoplanes atraurantiacus]